VAQQEKVTY